MKEAEIEKRMKKAVKLGNITLGDGHIYIQSMLNIPANDVAGNVQQAVELEKAGCEIIRVAVPTLEDVRLIKAIRSEISVPLVADIHFNYKIALACADAGVDKIRINPGNIGGENNVREVANACRFGGIPIRIGVNSGSVEKKLLAKYGSATAEAMVESALLQAEMLEKFGFGDIVISIKSSSVRTTISAYRKLAAVCGYPLHLGVTEAGTERRGIIKSAVGIGSLLCDNIGDTIRVSLTANPVQEVAAARDILQAVGLGSGVEIVSCPTCGRTQIDLVSLAQEVEAATAGIKAKLKIAVMGCVVNGPGEAREADFGIAGGKGEGLLFKKGEIIAKLPENQLITALMTELRRSGY